MCFIYLSRGWNSSVGSVLGVLSGMIQHCGFDPLWGLPVEGIVPLELRWVLTPFPNITLLDESINRGPVCACMHFIKWTEKILTFTS